MAYLKAFTYVMEFMGNATTRLEQRPSRVFLKCVLKAKAAGMTNAARECYKSTAAPYAEVPKEVMALARKW